MIPEKCEAAFPRDEREAFALGLPEPAYHHHRLILDDEGRKLSKATQATSLRQLRAEGTSAADIRRMVELGQ